MQQVNVSLGDKPVIATGHIVAYESDGPVVIDFGGSKLFVSFAPGAERRFEGRRDETGVHMTVYGVDNSSGSSFVLPDVFMFDGRAVKLNFMVQGISSMGQVARLIHYTVV